jgi:HEAT repeat protein
LLGREYGPTLLTALAKRSLHFGGTALTLTDAASLQILHRELNNPRPDAVLFALDKFEELESAELPDLLLKTLAHASPDVRHDGLRRLERLNLKQAIPAVQALLKTEPVASVRGAALRALSALEGSQADAKVADYLDDSKPTVRLSAMAGLLRSGGVSGAALVVEQLEQMIVSPDTAKRLQAAQLLSRAAQGQHYGYVLTLLKDSDPTVRRAAVIAAGAIKSPRLWPVVIDSLSDPAAREEAVVALIAGGDTVLLSIRAALAQPDLPRVTARRLLRIVSRMRGEAAIIFLKDWLDTPAIQLRQQAIEGLQRNGYVAVGADGERIKNAIGVEAAGAAQLLAYWVALGGVAIAESAPRLHTALSEMVAGYQVRVLSLLSFVYDRHTLARVRDSLQHAEAEKRAYGLEALDTMLADDLKPLVLSLVDDLPPDKRLQKLAAIAPAPLDHETTLTVLSQGQRWVNLCARAVLRDLYPHKFIEAYAMEEQVLLTTIERVMVLRSVSIFAGVPESVLAEVAGLLEEVTLNTGETLFNKDETGRCLYIIVNGRLKVHDGDLLLSQLDDRDVVGEMAVLDSSPRLASVTAETSAKLLKLDQDPLYELMADRVEVARGIIHVLTHRLRTSMKDRTDLQAQLQAMDVKRQ